MSRPSSLESLVLLGGADGSLKWRKTLGERQTSWIGFHFDSDAETIGQSEHRAS
jgi:hypothetical protein